MAEFSLLLRCYFDLLLLHTHKHTRHPQISFLERTIQYLSYPDIESLRNCCLYLHNLTKEMRLSWRLFPLERTVIVTRVVSITAVLWLSCCIVW